MRGFVELLARGNGGGGGGSGGNPGGGQPRDFRPLPWASTNVVFDGNSLINGQGVWDQSTQALDSKVAALAPMAGTTATRVKLGINGQSWHSMTSNRADVASAWVEGKTNVLVLWETTNAVFLDNRTAAQVIDEIRAYVNAVKADHPGWRIVYMTTLPRQISGGTQAEVNDRNLRMLAVDGYVQHWHADMGIEAVCDVRQPGSAFAFQSFSEGTFAAQQQYWAENGVGQRIHLNETGYAYVAEFVAETLGNLVNWTYEGRTRTSTLDLKNGDDWSPSGRYLLDWTDETAPDLGQITSLGMDIVPDRALHTVLRGYGFHGMEGSLRAGLEAHPLPTTASFRLIPTGAPAANRVLGYTHNEDGTSTGNDGGAANDGGGYARGVMLHGGFSLELWGSGSKNHQGLIAGHIQAGDTSFVYDAPVYARAGTKFMLGPTFFLRGEDDPKRSKQWTVDVDTLPTVGNVGGGPLRLQTVVTIREVGGFDFFRWGLKQYVTGAGVSLVDSGVTAANLDGHAPAWANLTVYAQAINGLFNRGVRRVYDQRAPVQFFTGNCFIEGPDDAHYQSDADRFGAHLMKHDPNGTLRLRFTQLLRMGQGGAQARYPLHLHRNAYNQDGSLRFNPDTGLSDGMFAPGSHVFEDVSIVDSWNRAVSLHACRGATLLRVNAFNIRGHALFEEDHAELYNTIDSVWIYKVTDPGEGKRLKVHDDRSSGFWLTNPQNWVRNCRGGDAEHAFWNSFSDTCVGLSRNVQIRPQNLEVLEFADNIGHSTFQWCMLTVGSVRDDRGIPIRLGFDPRVGGTTDGAQLLARFTRFFLYKGNGSDSLALGAGGVGNYTNLVAFPLYDECTVGDCKGTDFTGSTQNFRAGSGLRRLLAVAYSLNHEHEEHATETPRCALASYHGTFAEEDCLFIGYAIGAFISLLIYHYGIYCASGTHESWDQYLKRINLDSKKMRNLFYINSHPGAFSPGPGQLAYWPDPYEEQFGPHQSGTDGNATLCAATLDWDGSRSATGRERSYVVFDRKFLTHGLTDLVDVPVAGQSLAKNTLTPFYGIEPVQLQDMTQSITAGDLLFRRVDENLVPVPAPEEPSGYADWYIKPQSGTIMVNNHTCVPRGSRVVIRRPGRAPSTLQTAIRISNLYRRAAEGFEADDGNWIGVPFPAGSTPQVYTRTGNDLNANLPPPSGNTAGDKVYTPVNSEAALEAAGPYRFWQDAANELVWIRLGPSLDASGGPEGPVETQDEFGGEFACYVRAA